MITSKFIWESFEKYEDEIFYIDSSVSYSFRDFYNKVYETACQKKLQFNKSEKVAIVIDNSIESLFLFFAILYNSAIPVLLSSKLPKEKIDSILNSIDCKHLINSNEFLHNQDSSLPEIQSYKETEDATIIFTSGSTSIPKAILHSYRNHYYSALGSNENIPIQTKDRWILSLPLNHIGGLSIIFRVLLAGGTLVGYDRTIPLENIIENLKVTHVSVVPAQLRRMMLYPEKLKTLKAILVGGGMIPDDLIAQSLDLNLPIFKTYGMSEMSSQVTTTLPNSSQPELKTSGKMLKYRELKIANDNEILVRGEVLCKKYLNAEMPIDSDGWFYTGDIGSLDLNGNLTITGRKDNMFISGGENIYPEPIEKIVLQMENIVEACIVPKESNEFGKVGVLFYKSTHINKLTIEELKNYLHNKVMNYEIPKEIFEFPAGYEDQGIKLNRKYLKASIDCI